ncbi:MAG: FHA domain-containing protein [Nitrospirae bacterium]|nr:FHA domain-containing protein [Nitrospirota bacterium]
MVNDDDTKNNDDIVKCDNCGAIADSADGVIPGGWSYDRTNLIIYCPNCSTESPTYVEPVINDTYEETHDSGVRSAVYVILKTMDGTRLKVNNGCILGRKYTLPYMFDDLKAISKLHARFIFENGKWFIEDLNSANGTFVNNGKIPPHKMIPVKKKDIIRFAGRLEFTIDEIT